MKKDDLIILEELWNVIQDRKKNPKKDSYTCELLGNPELIREKIREEADEIIEASKNKKFSGKDSLQWEISDLMYHLMVLLASQDVDFGEVLKELKKRRK